MNFQHKHNYTKIEQEAEVIATDSSAEVEDAQTIPLSPLIAASPHWNVLISSRAEAGFTPLVAFCFTVNYILGTGFLTIPWAFVQSGLALSCILMFISGIISDMAKDYLLETMARAEAMLDSEMHWIPIMKKTTDKVLVSPARIKRKKRGGQRNGNIGNEDEDGEEAPNSNKDMKQQISFQEKKMDRSPQSRGGGTLSLPSTYQRQLVTIHAKPTEYIVRNRKFEVNTLCRVFLGKKGVLVFTLFISLYIFGLLWAYTSVFASAMSRALPIRADDNLNYIFYTCIFGSLVIPLSCLELKEQVVVQVIMTGCRFLMLFLMIGTSHLCANDSGAWYDEDNDAPMFRPSGLYKTLPILVVALMFHHSIPGLSDPVAEKRSLGGIFRSTSFFTSFIYAVIGVILGSSFGKSIEQSSNLNWKGFGSGEDSSDARWWAEAAAFYIMLFPALDVVSAFPLNAITLGNNMFGAFYGGRVHEMENNRCARICFRLLASVPPVIGGAFIRELGLITDYTGSTGFVIGFSIPALLFYRSKTIAKRKGYSTTTFYTSYASSDCISQVIYWFGIIMLVMVLFSLVYLR